jgi:hypothetical protein
MHTPSHDKSFDYSERDSAIRINSYTTVLRRAEVPHLLFDTYWRDVHGPLCSRIPGLGWYVQHHFKREHDGHLWPRIEGLSAIPDYELDGAVEIGFASEDDQSIFTAASPLLFSDEQNVFEETLAYALPNGSQTILDRLVDPVPNGSDSLDRLHVHFSVRPERIKEFRGFMAGDFVEACQADAGLLKLRLHLPETYDNAAPSPPAPNVKHIASDPRVALGIIELAFSDSLARRRFFESAAFQSTVDRQRLFIQHISAFAVEGVFTYVRDSKLTTAGLRGSRAAQLIEALAAANQVSPDVEHLMRTGNIFETGRTT